MDKVWDFSDDEEITLEDVLDEGDTEDADMVLEFFEDGKYTFFDADEAVVDALSEFEFDDILALNEMDVEEAVLLLFMDGHIGLPELVEYDEEVSDTPPEEIED